MYNMDNIEDVVWDSEIEGRWVKWIFCATHTHVLYMIYTYKIYVRIKKMYLNIKNLCVHIKKLYVHVKNMWYAYISIEQDILEA